MVSIKERFRVDIDSLQSLQIASLRTLKTVGEKHLKYYADTMSAFKFPEKRVKCHDTIYYEKMIPEVNRILDEYDRRAG